MSLSTTGQVELSDLESSFQPKPLWFHDLGFSSLKESCNRLCWCPTKTICANLNSAKLRRWKSINIIILIRIHLSHLLKKKKVRNLPFLKAQRYKKMKHKWRPWVADRIMGFLQLILLFIRVQKFQPDTGWKWVLFHFQNSQTLQNL